jgi:hypothetical protein
MHCKEARDAMNRTTLGSTTKMIQVSKVMLVSLSAVPSRQLLVPRLRKN